MQSTNLRRLPIWLLIALPSFAWAQVKEQANSDETNASSDAYVGRVTGKPVKGVVRTRGTTTMAPGFSVADVKYEDRAGLAPGDIGEQRPLGPKPITAADVAPKPTAAAIILKGYEGREITPGSDKQDATMSNIQSRIAQEAYAAEQANKPSWLDRVEAAVDQNWIGNQIIRGLDAEADRPDPAWAKKFSDNLFDMTAMAQDEDEWAMLTSPQAQATEAGYKKAKQAMLERRKRIETIYADDNGALFALSAFVIDPIKMVILFIIAMIFRNPYRKIRMGMHLARMTSVLERVERTRITMPIGAGGGIDSLPKSKQIIAVSALEKGISYLRNFEKSDVTDALIKNMQTAQKRELHIRYDSMTRLLELLIRENVAMDLKSWVKLRNVGIPNMILD